MKPVSLLFLLVCFAASYGFAQSDSTVTDSIRIQKQSVADTVPSTPDSLKIFPRYGVDLERHISILGGYNFWKNHYGELGLALNQYGRVGHHPAAWAYFVSSEIRVGENMVIGPKIGAWIGGGSGGLALGLNLIYYTDFVESSLRLRPEIGMGFGRWKVVYGYNIPLMNKGFEAVNKSVISLAYLLGIKKTKTIQK